MNRNRLLQINYTLMICALSASGAYGSDDIEFDVDVLDIKDRSAVDLKKFSSGNYIPEGTYLLDLKLNGAEILQDNFYYIKSESDKNKTTPCLTSEQIDKLALTDNAIENIKKNDSGCFFIESLDGVIVTNKEGILDLSIPQAWLKYSDPNWVPPERWDDGISGGFLDYSINGYKNTSLKNNATSSSLSGYGTAGFNIGGWRLRGDYQLMRNDTSNSFDWSQIYVYKPLKSYAATLKVGEQYSSSFVFEGFRFTGINLKSDEAMLPPSLRGYAPEVRGIAKSNATVRISHEGRVLYETTVPAGPFNIRSLNAAVKGTLDVKVEEQDGSVYSFQVDTANIPYLTRPGYVRFNLSSGKSSDYTHELNGPNFYMGDFSWGVGNSWSLYGGGFVTNGDFSAWSLGVGRDLGVFGSLSTDITQSMSKDINGNMQNGVSFKLSYAKTFDEYDSSITFAGYRFSQENYRTYSDYLQENINGDNSVDFNKEKEMYTITGTKTFFADDEDRATTVYLTYTKQSYWNSQTQNRYGLSVSKQMQFLDMDINLSLAAYRTYYDNVVDDSASLSLSIPLGDGGRWVSNDTQISQSDVSTRVSYSDNTDSKTPWRIGTGINARNKPLLDGFYTYKSSYFDMTAQAGIVQDEYKNIGGSISGGITATRHGVAIHRGGYSDLGRIMVDTDSVSGVPFNGGETKTNIIGIGVIPNVSAYTPFDARIDIDDLSEGTESSYAVSTSVLTQGAIGYKKFAVSHGVSIQAILRYSDGSFPPFGAELINKNGVSSGMVTEDGNIFISGVSAGDVLNVKYSGMFHGAVNIPENLNISNKVILLPCSR